MINTTNYGLNIAQGSDIVNPLIVDNPNYETIDRAMFANKNASVQTAVELKSGSIHVLTRNVTSANVFKFVATSDFTAGETFTVDGVQVTAYTTNSQPLTTNCYRIGATVICALNDTVLTVFVSGVEAGVASDSEKLGGQLPAYYAKQSDMTTAQQNIVTISGLATGALQKTGGVMTGTVTGATSPNDSVSQFRNSVIAVAGTDPTTLNVPVGTIIFILK